MDSMNWFERLLSRPFELWQWVHHRLRHEKVRGPWWFLDCEQCQAEGRAAIKRMYESEELE